MSDIVDRLWFQKEEFIGKIRDGIMPFHAAIEVGWTPAQMRRLIKDDLDFAELLNAAEEQRDEVVEESLYQMATNKHFGAIQLWLFNKHPDKWSDKKYIEVRTEGVMVHVIDTARETLKGFLAEAVDRRAAIAALQPGGVLDVEEADGPAP